MGLENTIEALAGLCVDEKIDTVIGVESRGFIFATPLAYQASRGFCSRPEAEKAAGRKSFDFI